MRRLLLVGCIIFCAAVTPLSALAQAVNPGAQAKIAAILAQFPAGGSGLSDAIALAVEADPSLAPVAVAAASTATPAQQQAIGTGLAIAATFFANAAAGSCQQTLVNGPPCPDVDAARAAEQVILLAMGSAPALAQASFTTGGGFSGLTASILGGTNNITTNSCISPSGAGGTCR